MNDRLLTVPVIVSNSTNITVESLMACFHDDDAFKYRAYRFSYLLVFPVAFICNIGALVVFLLQSSRRNGSPRCFEPSSPSSWSRVLVLNYVALALGFLLPFLTIIICYSRLIRHLTTTSGPAGSEAARRNRRRSVHLVTMVTATFLLCFLPYHVIRSLHLHAVCGGWSCNITLPLQRAVVVTLCLAASNSMVNPLLYYYATRSFRDNMRDAHASLLSTTRGSFRSGLVRMRRRNTT